MATESSQILQPQTVDSSLRGPNPPARTEIDTSAPFESVKEAASRFGGMGFWKPASHKPSEQASEYEDEIVDVVKLEEEAAQLERDLIAKERETLDVLKELESTKNTVEELKQKLQKETSEINVAHEASQEEKKENETDGLINLCPSSAPGFILLELKQAKLNLTRTTSDLAGIRATIGSYNKKIEEERASLEKTRQRLSSNTSKISSLENELSQTKHKLDEVKRAGGGSHTNISSSDVNRQLQQLSSEAEQFKKVGQAAQSRVQKAISEIEQTKNKIKTAEIRLIAAKKMKEAARASERVALAEIKALSKSEEKSENVVTLTVEEYSSLVSKARESEEISKCRVEAAMVKIDEADLSKVEILRKVEEATEEVKTSKLALEEALSRVEIANRDKLAVEEALRAWRSDHGRKRRPVQNPTKFKTSSGLGRVTVVNDGPQPVLKTTLSIGQILSRKLMLTEEYENGNGKVSLGQMLGQPTSGDLVACKKGGKENKEQLPVKRKKFGFARISLLVSKQSKKKKRSLSSSSISLCLKISMDTRILLFILIVSSWKCCKARDLKSDIDTVMQSHEKDARLCTLCEEFAGQALNYLNQNKTQTEILNILHKSCSKLRSLEPQCIVLVDYYAPLFFLEVSNVQADEFCRKVDLCEEGVSFSHLFSKDKCDICHNVVTEALLKLKDPDTELEIVQLLLKACDSIGKSVKKCKKLVFEYAPIILVNAEEFLEKNDVCSILRACNISMHAAI
ncbi:WEB family protein [Striga hermonthica]|uniref:Pulmonary surfactant-associated protein B n=1 Tax=Striga hermonthica TaxID=68872 RepID=A0A9N7NU84_STRHE|nr:WEB family protein [Striga hermonthica]